MSTRSSLAGLSVSRCCVTIDHNLSPYSPLSLLNRRDEFPVLITTELPPVIKFISMGDNFDIRASDREDGPFKDYPPRASLLEDLYRPLPVLTIAIDGNSLDLDSISNGVVQGLSSALNSSDYDELHNLFYSSQAFYRDSLAMTYHKRTIKGPETISLALLELAKERETSDFQLTPGSQYMAVKPSLVRMRSLRNKDEMEIRAHSIPGIHPLLLYLQDIVSSCGMRREGDAAASRRREWGHQVEDLDAEHLARESRGLPRGRISAPYPIAEEMEVVRGDDD